MMRLLKLVSLSKLRKVSQIFSLLGGAVLFVSFVAWSSETHGFDRGYNLGKSSAFSKSQVDNSEVIEFSQSDGTYKGLSVEYANLAYLVIGFVFFCLLLVLHDFGLARYVFTIFTIAIMVIVRIKLVSLAGLKDPLLNESLGSPFNVLASESAFFDHMSIVLVSLLTLVQIVAFISLAVEHRTGSNLGQQEF